MRRLYAIVVASLLLAACSAERPAALTARSATMVSSTQADPLYWLSQPSKCSAAARDFDKLFAACADTARDYLFQIDRQDYRQGLLTTRPMVSEQFFELWRKDAGTEWDVAQSSLQTIRRTVRFEVVRNRDGTFVAHPQVLVERLSQLERRVTSVAEYRYVFIPAAPADEEPVSMAIPSAARSAQRYWYPIGRDRVMETDMTLQVLDRLRD